MQRSFEYSVRHHRELPSRRTVLAGIGTLAASTALPCLSSAAQAADPRLVVLILRGGLDGLNAAPPVGDPAYAATRPDIKIEMTGDIPAIPLDGTFALHPSLRHFHTMYRQGEALVLHAVATPYRERSHFDGQDVLESGGPSPRALDTGWLNRMLTEVPSAGRITPVKGLGVSASVPLILRGPAPTVTWTPPRFSPARADTIERLEALYASRDPALAGLLERGLEVDRLAAGMERDASLRRTGRIERGFIELARAAARLLAAEEGPRVAAISYDGWDTHVNEGAAIGRLPTLLSGLDAALEALRSNLGQVWRQTAVLVITEFGRTVRENGTDGTDHGTGTVAFLLGGGVKGGRVVADWPGLAPEKLLDGRDLRPTADLRSVIKGVLEEHMHIAPSACERIFPGGETIRPLRGLLA